MFIHCRLSGQGKSSMSIGKPCQCFIGYYLLVCILKGAFGSHTGMGLESGMIFSWYGLELDS